MHVHKAWKLKDYRKEVQQIKSKKGSLCTSSIYTTTTVHDGIFTVTAALGAPHYTVYERITLQNSKNWSSRILELTHGHKHLIQWNH
jgi:hypothetical protein